MPETKEYFVLGSNKSKKTWWIPTCRGCMYPNQNSKTCPRCKKKKSINCFYLSPNDRLCKECLRKYQKERRKFKSDKKVADEINGNLKAINLYKELNQKVCVLMRTNRIGKYNNEVRNIILGFMKISYKHLEKELKNNKEVIEVDWE